jgi:MFS family permease
MPAEKLFTRPFIFCSLANFAQCLAFNLFLHLPGYLRDMGADELGIGWIFGVASLAAIVVRPPIGRVMDQRGRRSVILAGGVLNVLVCGSYLSVSEIGSWIYTVRIIHGLSEAMLFTSLFTFAADLVPAARRTEGLALFGVSGMLPMAIAGMLGDAILVDADYGTLFRWATGFAAASLLLSLPLHDPPRDVHGAVPSRGFRAALVQPDLMPLWWIGTIFAVAIASAFAFLKTFVESTGIGSVGAFFAAYSGAALTLRLLFAWLPDRIGAKRVLFPALAALALGFFVLAGAGDTRDVVLAGLLCGSGHGYAFPILFSMVVTRASDSDRGSATAIFTALFDLGLVLGGPLFGWISRSAGYSPMYTTAAAVIVVGTAVYAFWDRRR